MKLISRFDIINGILCQTNSIVFVKSKVKGRNTEYCLHFTHFKTCFFVYWFKAFAKICLNIQNNFINR
jgi:hypothetical protein